MDEKAGRDSQQHSVLKKARKERTNPTAMRIFDLVEKSGYGFNKSHWAYALRHIKR